MFSGVIADIRSPDQPIPDRNVVIINSYTQTLAWTSNQTEGIIEQLRTSEIPIKISIENLDWKNYPTHVSLDYLTNLYTYRYANKPVDAVITTDDAALTFILDKRTTIFPHSPIIFSGLNGYDTIRPDHYLNVTGVTEEIDPESTIFSIFTLLPDTKQVWIISDDTESGEEITKKIVKASEKFTEKADFIFRSNMTISEVEAYVKTAPVGTAILIGSYVRDKEGVVIDYGELTARLAPLCPVPIFTMYDMNMGYGAVGGSIISGKTQGRLAGRLTVQILQGKPASQIPVLRENTTSLIFDANILSRFNIPKTRIPQGSSLINQSEDLVNKYFSWIISAIIIFLIMGAMLITTTYMMMMRRRAERKLYTVLDALPALAFFKSTDGKYQMVNQRFCEVVGISQDEIKGRTDSDIFPSSCAIQYHADDMKVIQSGEQLLIPEEFIPTSDGGMLPLSTRKVPLTNPDGSITGVIGLGFDITEIKKAQQAVVESESRFKGLVESSHDLIVELDKKGIFTYISPHVTNMLGYYPEQLIGTSFKNLLSSDNTGETAKKVDSLCLRTSSFRDTDIEVLHADRTKGTITLEINGAPFYDIEGNLEGYRAVARDISERKRIKDALRRANSKLNLFNTLTRTTMNNHLFILRGYLNFATEISTEPEVQNFLKKGEEALAGVEQVIQFMKNYQDLGVNPPLWQPVDQVFLYAISHLDMSGVSRELEVDDLSIFADPFLEKVFEHLVHDSIKHGKSMTVVRIRYEMRDEQCLLIYEDNGVGIHQDQKDKIFTQGPDKRAGIGLLLVREILSITGITIKETGTPGEGVRFEMQIPHDGYRSSIP
jgi:PAS domain S-box-containing protein